MPKVFISYRRDDASGHAGRLYDEISRKFGRKNVFMDIDTIRPGMDFLDALTEAITSSDVILVVIGRRWVDAVDDDGLRRLDDPEDFVRLELMSALERGMAVVPVLVQDASMPRSRLLPEPLRSLARRQAVEVRDTRWGPDVDGLTRVLREAAKIGTARPRPTSVSQGRLDPSVGLQLGPPGHGIVAGTIQAVRSPIRVGLQLLRLSIQAIQAYASMVAGDPIGGLLTALVIAGMAIAVLEVVFLATLGLDFFTLAAKFVVGIPNQVDQGFTSFRQWRGEGR